MLVGLYTQAHNSPRAGTYELLVLAWWLFGRASTTRVGDVVWMQHRDMEARGYVAVTCHSPGQR
jgi:hypothetical protein